MKKGLVFVLSLMFIVLQYRLWGGQSTLLDVYRLRKAIVSEQKGMLELTKRNQTLDAEVKFLKLRPAALEERARAELGMVKKGETFCLVVEPAR
jgi:cell division protein FtsB